MPSHSATSKDASMQHSQDRRPIYQRLRDQISAEIAQNVWRPGDAIASEMELATKYKISVGTVRKAVDALVNDGLVERISGSGTFVRRPDFEHAFIRFTRVYGSAGDQRVPDSHIFKRETLPGPINVTKALNLNDGAQVIRLLRLRTHAGKPVVHEEIWLDEARFSAILTHHNDQPRLLYPLYEDLCGVIVARAEEEITIELANETDIGLLKLSKGAPVVSVVRRALGYDDCPIEWRCSRSSALDFHYKIDVR